MPRPATDRNLHTTAICRFSRSWTALKGCAFGLSQSTILGRATVRLPREFDFGALDGAMARHIDEPVPALPPGTAPEHALLSRLLHWSSALQRKHGIAVSHRFHIAPVNPEPEDGPMPAGALAFRLAAPYVERDAASVALNWASKAVSCFLELGRLSPEDGHEQISLDEAARLLEPFREDGINTYRFLRAADDAGIPVTRILQGLYSFGVDRPSRWLFSSMLDSTSAIAAQVARDKVATANILRRAGLPASRHIRVAQAAQAVEAARTLGFPVVVKPADLDQGAGVAAGLTDEAAVRAAFDHARGLSESILVEKHFDGVDYRVVVLDHQIVQIFAKRPGGVRGDGSSTIAQLVQAAGASQEARRRRRDFRKRMLELDAEALDILAGRDMGPDSVIPDGEFVALRRRSNVSTGGEPVPVAAAAVHPDNAALAIHAAAALRLDFAGVDLIMADISRSWLDTGALICEVNAMPQLSISSPSIYRDVLRIALGDPATIPVWLHLSDTVPPFPDRLLSGAPGGTTLGYASARGIRLNGAAFSGPQPDGFTAARALLRQQPIDAAIVHLTPDDILRDGLPFNRCARAIVETSCLGRREALSRLLLHADEIVAETRIDGLPPDAVMTLRTAPESALADLLTMMQLR